MGADLLLSHLWMDARRKPDWYAARSAITTMTFGQLSELSESIDGSSLADDDEKGCADLRLRLHGYLDDVEALWEGRIEWRDVVKCALGPIDVLITGGMSWGDSPTEAFDMLNAFCDSPAAVAAGFYFWPVDEVAEEIEHGD